MGEPDLVKIADSCCNDDGKLLYDRCLTTHCTCMKFL